LLGVLQIPATRVLALACRSDLGVLERH
jgi:hypothetical protein